MTVLHISSEAQLHYNDVDHHMQISYNHEMFLEEHSNGQTLYIANVSQTPTAC